MIHFVIGTRAQLFKLAPVMLECENRGLQWRWIYAAQHADTIDQALSFFGLPRADSKIIEWNSEAKTFGKMWYWLVRVFLKLPQSKRFLNGQTGKSHIVLTHGDTFSTILGALMGKLTGTHVMHVESGLRSHNWRNPFPEEINRIITFRLSSYFACPGEWALNNVKDFKGVKINTFENTQKDVVEYGLKNLHKASLELPNKKYVVLSTHRYENVFNKQRLETILDIAEDVAQKYQLVIPLHPVTKVQLIKLDYLERLASNQNIILLPRLEYENYLKLISNSEFVMTDGGGNQEELYHLGIPTLILRNETERNEGLGVTSVLSKLDRGIVNEFVENYTNYIAKPTQIEVSPTSIIVDAIAKFG